MRGLSCALLCLLITACDRREPETTEETPKESEGLVDGVSNGRVRHIQCTDKNGIVVLNTNDIYEAPHTTPTAWKWDNAARTKHTQITVPTHDCLYSSEDVLEEPSQ